MVSSSYGYTYIYMCISFTLPFLYEWVPNKSTCMLFALPFLHKWRAKMSRCLMNEVTMDLTSVASLSISDGVRNHLWPIISKSSESISRFWTRLVSPTHTIMSLFEYFLCLFVWQAAEEDSIMRSVIHCSCDRIVVEFRSFPSNGSRLFKVIRQNVVQCVVDVRESPIPEL